MKDFIKGKFTTAIVVLATIILAGVAVFTALKLYQLRQSPVAPNAPSSNPSARGTPQACQVLTFTLTQNSPTITPTIPPGVTATLTPTEELTLTPTLVMTQTVSPTPIITPPDMPGPPQCSVQAPETPILVSVKRSGTKVTLTWSKVALATHYVISYGLTADNFQYGVPNTGNVTTFTIESLKENTKYYFTVYAVNDCQPSKGSAVLSTVSGSSTQGDLPNAGLSVPTVVGLFGGFAFIAFAILLAI